MKLIEKTDLMDGDWSYQWTAEELKNEKDCLRLAISACTLGELDRVECRGYMDMDTHENYCSFKSQRDFANGLDHVKKIEADDIDIFLKVNGKDVRVNIGPCSDQYENWISVSGKEETVKAVSAKIQKMLA